MDLSITPIAYKYRLVKDGLITEFVALREISIEDAKEKIRNFSMDFKVISQRKADSSPHIQSSSGNTDKIDNNEDGKFSYACNYNVLPEFFSTRISSIFTRPEYQEFVESKGIKLEHNTVSDDLNTYVNKSIIERAGYGKYKILMSGTEALEALKSGRVLLTELHNENQEQEEPVEDSKDRNEAKPYISTNEITVRIKEFLRDNPDKECQVPELEALLELTREHNRVSYIINKLKEEGFIFIVNPLDNRQLRRFKLSENQKRDKIDTELVEALKKGRQVLLGTIQ